MQPLELCDDPAGVEPAAVDPVAVDPVATDPALVLARRERGERGERGQASVEYALVLLGAALVATLLISWATSTDLIGALFDKVIGIITGKAS